MLNLPFYLLVTAESSDINPDEALHLAAAMQFSGFRSVVGTLWAMADIDGEDLAKEFYKSMMSEDEGREVGFRKSARALHDATRNMRRQKGMTLERWVNFVHIGA
jgi:CHAT domain-containing protein